MLDTVAERRRGAGELIDDLRKPGGSVRQALLARIEEIADELVASRRSPTRSGSSLRAIVNRPQVSAWLAPHPGTRYVTCCFMTWNRRRRNCAALSALMIVSFGETLRTDAAICERLNAIIEAVVAEALPWRSVTAVVRRWEPRSFSDRIEAAVGADLQYIRMNGTVVGGLVGGALHLLAMSTQ